MAIEEKPTYEKQYMKLAQHVETLEAKQKRELRRMYVLASKGLTFERCLDLVMEERKQ